MNESDIKSIKLDVRTSFRMPKGMALLSQQEQIELGKKSAEYEDSSNYSSPGKGKSSRKTPPKSRKTNERTSSRDKQPSTSQSKQTTEKKANLISKSKDKDKK